LNIPLRGDGSPDADSIAIVEGIAAWMQINQEAIHGTRPWKVLGEGPQLANLKPMQGPGFNEGEGSPFSAEDIRFVTKGATLYAHVLGAPKSTISIKSFGTAAKLLEGEIASVTLVGSDEKLMWSQTTEALTIEAPQSVPNEIAAVFEITLRD
jgi:alpha-L-fucosidase